MLPKEIWMEAPLLNLEGNGFMRIENYQSILEFTDERLKLRMKGMVYEVQGTNLIIRGVTKREIFVGGEIHGLLVQQEAKR